MKKPEEKEGKSARLHAGTLFLAALAVRAACVLATSAGADEVRGDAVDYFAAAVSLADKGAIVGQWGMRALHMPLYPLFLAGVFCWSGPSVAAAQAAQVLLGSATCVLLYKAARRLLDPHAALFAGWSAVFYFGLVYPCGRILTECLYSFLLAVFLLRWSQWGTKKAAGLGAAAAALYLTRPEGMFAGLCAAALGPRTMRGWKARHSLTLVLFLAAAAGTWALRNQAVLGVPTPGTSNTGFTAWFALPRTIEEKLGRGGPPQPDAFADELRRDRYYRGRAARVLRESSPALLAKAALFNLVSIHYPFLPAYEATYVFLAPFWLLALLRIRSRLALWPAAAMVLAWTGLFVFVGGADSRFRQLFSPCLILLAAAGFADLHRRLGAPMLARAASAWAAANALIFLAAPALRAALLSAVGR